jgi:hypothetical protein
MIDTAALYRANQILGHAQALVELLQEEPPGVGLPVPYLGQWGEGADERRGDCGPACVAMLAHFLSRFRPSVDQAAAACGQPVTAPGSHYTNHAQLRAGAQAYGFGLRTCSEYNPPKLTPDLIKANLDDGRPVIALVHYGVLRDHTNGTGYAENQDRNYERGHWFLVVGYDADGYIVNDPDYWGDSAYLGDHRYIPCDAFELALATIAPGCTAGHQGLIVR